MLDHNVHTLAGTMLYITTVVRIPAQRYVITIHPQASSFDSSAGNTWIVVPFIPGAAIKLLPTGGWTGY